MSFLDSPSSLDQLTQESRDLLSKVDHYVLDYNIFLFKGIQKSQEDQNEELFSFLATLMDAIPSDYKDKIFNPVKDGKAELTTTAKLQLRLLELLIHERHRRDIEVINKQLGDKLEYIKLKEPFRYEIKSPFYLTFKQSNEEYQPQFYKFALMQSLEYDFEHDITQDDTYQNDNDLIKEFCSDAVLDFELKDAKKQEDILDSELIKVLIPLAAQVILMQEDEK